MPEGRSKERAALYVLLSGREPGYPNVISTVAERSLDAKKRELRRKSEEFFSEIIVYEIHERLIGIEGTVVMHHFTVGRVVCDKPTEIGSVCVSVYDKITAR